MAEIVFMELGFPIVLVDPPMRRVRGQNVPDVNPRALQAAVFRQLITKPARLSGAEVRFVRKYLRMRQADLASALNRANHSVVSQWEGRGDDATGMDYNTEVLLRVWMATKAGMTEQVPRLIEHALKGLQPSSAPLVIPHGAAA